MTEDRLSSDLPRLLACWPLPRPWQIEGLTEGTNTPAWRVEGPAGRFVLRVHPQGREAVVYQYELLAELSRMDLTFAVPAPMAGLDGDVLVTLPDREGWVASLTPFLPGVHPYGTDPTEVRMIGQTFANLDRALEGIDLPPPAYPAASGDFLRHHAAVPDPAAVPSSLPLSPEEQRTLARAFADLQERTPALDAMLPRQIVHRDLDPGNVLVQNGRVTAILDFEFARPDVRALDLAVAHIGFAWPRWDDPVAQNRLQALAAGYLEVLPLTPAEVAALPDMMRRYRAGSLIHREGMRREGRATMDDVLARARGWLRLERYLASGTPGDDTSVGREAGTHTGCAHTG